MRGCHIFFLGYISYYGALQARINYTLPTLPISFPLLFDEGMFCTNAVFSSPFHSRTLLSIQQPASHPVFSPLYNHPFFVRITTDRTRWIEPGTSVGSETEDTLYIFYGVGFFFWWALLYPVSPVREREKRGGLIDCTIFYLSLVRFLFPTGELRKDLTAHYLPNLPHLRLPASLAFCWVLAHFFV